MKVLFFMLGSIGDTVVSLPSIRATARHFGASAHFYVLQGRQRDVSYCPADVLRACLPIERYIDFYQDPKLHRKAYSAWQAARAVRRFSFDAVVNLTGTQRRSTTVGRDSLFFKWCGIKNRLGFSAVNNGGGKGFSESRGRLERLRLDGVDISEEENLDREFWTVRPEAALRVSEWLTYRSAGARPMIAICPGCKQPANKWPLQRFVELGLLLKSYPVELVVIGGEAEKDAGDWLVEQWKGGVNAAGVFSVEDSAALIKRCSLLVGLDTGTTHIAGAVGTPCVAIYGGRDPDGLWYPLGTHNQIVRHSVACEGCLETRCPKVEHPCIKNILVEQVLRAIAQIGKELSIWPDK